MSFLQTLKDRLTGSKKPTSKPPVGQAAGDFADSDFAGSDFAESGFGLEAAPAVDPYLTGPDGQPLPAATVAPYTGQLQQVAEDKPGFARVAGVASTFKGTDVRSLSPARLNALMRQADQGDWAAQCEIFSEVESNDPHIHAEMSKRRRAILTVPWAVVPPDDPTDLEAEQARWLTTALQRIPDFDEVLVCGQDAIGHGFSCQEIMWQLFNGQRPGGAASGTGNAATTQYWAPQSIQWRPPSLFQLDRDALVPGDHTSLRLRDYTPLGQQLYPERWLIDIHRSRPTTLQRAGLYRTLAWYYLFKHYSITDCAEFLEIYGLPMRVGTYPQSASDGDKRTLLRALVALGHDAAAVVPEGMLIEFKESAKSTGDAFLPFIEFLDRGISKAIVGQTLSSQTGQNGGGSHALGKVHQEVQRDLLLGDARQRASAINRDLIGPMVRMNFGNIDPNRMPRLVFETVQPQDIETFATALPALAAAGMKIGVAWAHEKLQIPVAEDGDALLIGPTAAAPVPQPSQPAEPGLPGGGDGGVDVNAASRKLGRGRFTALLAQDVAQGNVQDDPARLEPALQAQAAAAWGDTVDQVHALVARADSLEALKVDLLRLYGGLDPQPLTDVMAAAFSVAKLRGIDAVRGEAK